jgi:hypothetical protein
VNKDIEPLAVADAQESNELPRREKSEYSLPISFSPEQLRNTMSNPKYADDIFRPHGPLVDRIANDAARGVVIESDTEPLQRLLEVRCSAENRSNHFLISRSTRTVSEGSGRTV